MPQAAPLATALVISLVVPVHATVTLVPVTTITPVNTIEVVLVVVFGSIPLASKGKVALVDDDADLSLFFFKIKSSSCPALSRS